jgi:hypothetical protein
METQDTQLVYGPFIGRAQAKAQGLKWYFTGTPCKHGHISEKQTANGGCRTCGSLKNAAKCKRWYERKGRAQVIETAKQWAQNNPDRRKEIANKHASARRADPVLNARHNQLRRDGNRNQMFRERFQNDRQFRTAITLRRRLAMALKAQSARKCGKTFEMLGMSVVEFMDHFATMFLPGMSWENHGEWHIDHIRPCASFDLTNPAQQRECFHYTNLQPLWASDNLAKGDTWEPSAA